ncbi:MAG: type I DNA topoisomerase [Alphaproteobacteria bacterium]|nr:type I DNA topoisomerase [Alphaproteobacteria bacterium]OJV46595.1 MAG: DNA topoisomerase I [Alphaproteobacteria bacterium 43-37]
MKVVIVESPSKAKTINKYLGRDYSVVASYGHIRDLPSKNGSVMPENSFAMAWEVDERSERHIKDICQEVKKSEEVLLATDPDREGEAISWHVLEILKERGVLKNQTIRRIVFNEITKTAVLKAIEAPRNIDQSLVEAYLTRRALDYLVGFSLSPILWRKLPGSRSAGRVQSVALRLICDRENEIESFINQEYWSINAVSQTAANQMFDARLVVWRNEKLDKLTLKNASMAEEAKADILNDKPFIVSSVEKKKVQRHPAPPFTTSTLQQEASRKLGFAASKTMKLAQRLYEGVEIKGETVGLITYMRTDSVNVSDEAIRETRQAIQTEFGDSYLPEKPKLYKTKSKNAQEAHEAIRPTSLLRKPEGLASILDPDLLKLYSLIWKRMAASQMASAVFDQVTAQMTGQNNKATLRATGTTRLFDGFLKLYEEGQDEEPESSDQKILPQLNEGDVIQIQDVKTEQHFTQPPPRYTEASLVKKLEELGIGRPSTYATILHVLQDRKYVSLDRKAFMPEERGRLVTAFLVGYFPRYVEYSFTADLENQLDDISDGKLNWKSVLEEFWAGFNDAIGGASKLKIGDVIEHLNQQLMTHFFPLKVPGEDPRQCPQCQKGQLSLKLGKYGAFIGCSDYPSCNYTRKLDDDHAHQNDEASDASENESAYPRALGADPVSSLLVSVRKGPYGFYLQWGENADAKDKIKRLPLPKNLSPANVTLQEACDLARLPRLLGAHPETNADVTAGIGRFGPYIKHQSSFTSLKKEDDVLTIDLSRALELLEEAKNRPATSGRGRKFQSKSTSAKAVNKTENTSTKKRTKKVS